MSAGTVIAAFLVLLIFGACIGTVALHMVRADQARTETLYSTFSE